MWRKGINGKYAVARAAIFAAAVLILASQVACGFLSGGPSGPPLDASPQAPNVVSIDPQYWYILYSAGMPAHPSTDSEGAWSFEFPSSESGGHVNYVQTPFTATTTPQTVTITFEVESDAPQYVVIDPSDHPPATVRLFFEQQNDNLSNPNGRWWANAGLVPRSGRC